MGYIYWAAMLCEVASAQPFNLRFNISTYSQDTVEPCGP